jgi:TerC family integral membrane protein
MVAWWAWAAVIAFIVGMLLIDLLVFHRDAHEVSTREAAGWSIVWVGLSLAFGGVVWLTMGGTSAGEYLGGYLIEKSLSVDNIFVFALVFGYFAVPPALQHRVLFWGVFGALVFRAMFIALGSALLSNFHWTIYVFGAFLVFTGVRMAFHQDTDIHPEHNPVLRLLRRAMPMTTEYRGQHFVVRDAAKWLATPLLAVLVVVETTDIVFAVDSIPAIFAVTDEAFIVLAANVFAVLGLRALYFVIVGSLDRFQYLNYGLAVVLGLVGIKMLLSDVYHPPIYVTLGAVVLVLGAAVLFSLWATRNNTDADRIEPGEPLQHP